MILRFRRSQFCPALPVFALLLAACAGVAGADEPYAPSKEYNLQNIRTHLWFDLDQRKIRGEVSQNISALREDMTELKLDSVGLTVQEVTLDGKAAKFSTTADKLLVSLARPAKRNEQHELFIKYEGHPKKGLYFILPDERYPRQPQEIWTQGEAEDTRNYIPLYDYPNNRMTSEMLLTVPGSWITVSNGKLVGVKAEGDGTRTWDWKQTEPLSSYLITAIAGDFVEKDDSWHGLPLRYVVPRGQEYKIDTSFSNTKQMLDLFSEKLAVPYPWAQYAQTFVDDFVEGGMENTSATTLTVRELVNPALAPESRTGADFVESHELAHQWFGDLVTCKDWANLWLNEGFATYFEHYWTEQHYGADDAAYEFWRQQNQWFRQKRMYPIPIVNRNFKDSDEYAGDVYTKAGWVLKMLREKLGDADFFRALRRYLETYRGQNVVTADLERSIEQATAINTDQFFHQWIYRAGAPQFQVSYSYDELAHRVRVDVSQTQKVEGLVGLFDVPIDLEITTARGPQTYLVEANQASQSFTFPADAAPQMVLFDKGDKILKTVDFKKSPSELIYQLKNAEAVTDRADAAVALGNVKDNSEAVAALGNAAQHDPFWGLRVEALRALGRIGGPNAEQAVLPAIIDDKPWVRDVAVQQLGNFKDDPSLPSKLEVIASGEKGYRVRAAALNALAELKAPGAYDTLAAAVGSNSPDNVIRNAALEGLGRLGDDKAVPLLLEWSAAGQDVRTRQVAMMALAGLDKKNKDVTKALVSYFREPYFDVSFWGLLAIGARGDLDAVAPLEEMLKGDEATANQRTMIEQQISALKAHANTAAKD
jgi:aminopeptidase N